MKQPYKTEHVTKVLIDYLIGLKPDQSTSFLKDKLGLDLEANGYDSVIYDGNEITMKEYSQLITNTINNTSVSNVAAFWGELLGFDTEVDPTEEYILY